MIEEVLIPKGLSNGELGDLLYGFHNKVVDQGEGRLIPVNYEAYIKAVEQAVKLYPEFNELPMHFRIISEYQSWYELEKKINEMEGERNGK